MWTLTVGCKAESNLQCTTGWVGLKCKSQIPQAAFILSRIRTVAAAHAHLRKMFLHRPFRSWNKTQQSHQQMESLANFQNICRSFLPVFLPIHWLWATLGVCLVSHKVDRAWSRPSAASAAGSTSRTGHPWVTGFIIQDHTVETLFILSFCCCLWNKGVITAFFKSSC